jgi:hypothetical protein
MLTASTKIYGTATSGMTAIRWNNAIWGTFVIALHNGLVKGKMLSLIELPANRK